MTCIVGVVEGGKVHLGGDSQGTDGYSKSTRLDPKVFKRGKFVIGFTSSFRMGQVLQHKLNVPDQPEGMDDHEFMVTTFIDAVRGCLKDSGFARKKEEVEEGGTFLVGYKGRLYEIQDDYQAAIHAEPYAAVGCGDDIAKGALFAQDPNVNPLHRIQVALEAASKFSAGVGAPFNFVSSD